MTFLEAALDILKREGRPLHFKELTERAMTKKLLTFVGRTPEVTMQTQLTAAVKKAPGNPFVRVKPGVFGLLRYPELTAEELKERDDKKRPAPSSPPAATENRPARRERAEGGASVAGASDADGEEAGGGRRRRRGARTRTGKLRDDAAASDAKSSATDAPPGRKSPDGEGLAGQPTASNSSGHQDAHDDTHDEAPEPRAGGLSAAARAAALAETGVLEGDHDDVAGDDDEDDLPESGDTAADLAADARDPGGVTGRSAGAAPTRSDGEGDEPGQDQEDDDEDGDGQQAAEGAPAASAGGAPTTAEGDELRRRRRRRRRRRGGGGGDDEAGTRLEGTRGAPSSEGTGFGGEIAASGDRSAPDGGRGSSEVGSSGSASEAQGEGGSAALNGEPLAGDSQQSRKIMTPVDAAIEILRSQPPGRGVHVRQLADSAIRRRLVHGEPNEAWRVIRTALAAEPKERLRNGQRPRVRAAGSGLYALARRPPDADLEKAEQVFGDARRALRERTMAAVERRLAELTPGAFEALARVLLQREGFGPTTFVKRVDGTIYVEALRGRGSRPAKCLIALRPGGTPAGRRAIGELRAGIRARNHDEGLLMLAGRLSDDAIAEWKQAGPPLEIADGSALAETCARHGVGVLSATVNVDFVDADFFSELVEG